MYLKKIILVLIASSTLWGLEINVPKTQSQVVPIIEAIKAKKYKNFEKLFDRSKLHKRYRQNQTLLHVATRYNNQSVAKLLVQKGAELNAIGGAYNATPLHTAIRYGNLKLAVYLIKYHADLNLQDKDGQTPLDIASRLGYSNIVQLLKQYGARRSKAIKERDDTKGEVNKYKHGSVINPYKNGNRVNRYQPRIKAEEVALRHIKIESDNREKNNKDIGTKNSKVDIGN